MDGCVKYWGQYLLPVILLGVSVLIYIRSNEEKKQISYEIIQKKDDGFCSIVLNKENEKFTSEFKVIVKDIITIDNTAEDSQASSFARFFKKKSSNI